LEAGRQWTQRKTKKENYTIGTMVHSHPKFALPIFFVIITGGNLIAQSVDDVIEKYVEAIGGIERLNSVKTVKVSGRIVQGSNLIPFVQYIKVPDKIKIEITRQGLTLQQAYDGSIGWTLNPFRGVKIPEKLNPEQMKDLKNQADFEGGLVNYEKKGSTAEYLGVDDFEGSEVYKIRITEGDGERTTYYIDVVTNLVVKKEIRRKIEEKEQKTEYFYGAYKQVNGLMVPFSIETGTGSGETQKRELDKVEFNVEIEDSIFKMPEGK